MYFRNYRLSMTWLNHSLESAVSEHPFTVNMLVNPKHLWNLHHRTFKIFFDHSEEKWLGKYLPFWSLKSLGCLLTHWLPMTIILFRIVRIFSCLFKCNYLKNKELFLIFLLNLWNLHQILTIFEKKMIVIGNVFPKLQTVKDLVKPLSWKCRFRTSFDSEHVNGCQRLVKSAWEHFYRIFWSIWGKMIWKISRFL